MKSWNQLRSNLLTNPNVKKEYDDLTPHYQAIRRLERVTEALRYYLANGLIPKGKNDELQEIIYKLKEAQKLF